MADTFARALLLLLKNKSKDQAFEEVWDSLDPEGVDDPKGENELCCWCGRGWKCLIYNAWCNVADIRGRDPKDLRAWAELLALYHDLKRGHERGCRAVPRWMRYEH